jgi:hypothetical protein
MHRKSFTFLSCCVTWKESNNTFLLSASDMILRSTWHSFPEVQLSLLRWHPSEALPLVKKTYGQRSGGVTVLYLLLADWFQCPLLSYRRDTAWCHFPSTSKGVRKSRGHIFCVSTFVKLNKTELRYQNVYFDTSCFLFHGSDFTSKCWGGGGYEWWIWNDAGESVCEVLRDLLIYLLKELSPSWETVNCAAIQELPSILTKPKVHHRVHKNPPLVPILSQVDPVYTIPLSLSKIHFNVVHPPTSWSS